MDPVYVIVRARRRGGATKVERHVKISEEGLLAVNPLTNTIKEINYLYSSPYSIEPSNKETFDKAHRKVKEHLRALAES